jgi:hypothetical protein
MQAILPLFYSFSYLFDSLLPRGASFFFSILQALRGSSADPSLIVEWEGLDALEPIEDATNAITEGPSEAANTQTKDAEKPPNTEVESEADRQQRPLPAELSESSDDGSGDEYVEDAGGNRHQRVRRSVPLCPELPRAHGSLSTAYE